MRDWLKHVRGASALLDFRGREQLGTPLGRRLFRDSRAQILSQCFLTRSAVPDTVIRLSRECQKCSGTLQMVSSSSQRTSASSDQKGHFVRVIRIRSR